MSRVAQSTSHTSRGVGGQKARQVWTAEEDRLLSMAVAKETPQNGTISWHRVAAHLQGRNNKDCRKRWHYSIANTIRKGTWTREEDQKLLEAVEVYGPRWSKIAESVGTRNGDQCWKRWYDCLDPRIDKSPWTPEEDSTLLVQVAEHGRNWTEIVNKHFPNRTSLSAKNRYSILQR
ncbi:Homeodomain-like protein, partial [Podospora didyma]